MSTWGDRLGVFDLETTGVDVDTSRIVSACIAVLDDAGGVVSRWNWLADPGIDIPEGASAVHGITTERAQREGRSATLVVAEIVQTLRVLFDSGIPVTVYNAPYDLSLLDRECRRHGLDPLDVPLPVIDPLVIDKALDRYRKGKRTLEITARLYEVPLDDAHDAGADAIAAGRVALALLHRYPDDLDIDLADLHGRQEVWHAEQAASFQEYLRAKRGDDSYVADPSWPLKPAGDPSSFVDTQPIPPLPPRPSGNVPVLDFSATGVLALEVSRGEETSREPSTRFSPDVYRNAPMPSIHERVDESFVAPPSIDEPFVSGDDDEPAWIVEPSEVPSVSVSAAESLSVVELVGTFPPNERDEPDRDEPDAVVDEVDAGVSEGFAGVGFSDEEFPGEEFADEDSLESSETEPVSANDAEVESGTEPTSAVESGPPPTVLRIAAAIVTDPQGRCLLVRKAGSSVFMQAGGKLEPGESALDALSRELREELDLELDESTAEYLGVFRAEAAHEPNTVVSAAVFALETDAPLEPAGEIEELLWIDRLDGIGAELAPLTRDELLPLWASRRAGATLF
ncbi:NUDIX domain-containing protein [Lysinimonas soli]|uniref:NUDIX domain-containing protein n=1 Tax=Lysinimonas soli TaxID=1074233 RepID=A0ABW0NNT2_9MICO